MCTCVERRGGDVDELSASSSVSILYRTTHDDVWKRGRLFTMNQSFGRRRRRHLRPYERSLCTDDAALISTDSSSLRVRRSRRSCTSPTLAAAAAPVGSSLRCSTYAVDGRRYFLFRGSFIATDIWIPMCLRFRSTTSESVIPRQAALKIDVFDRKLTLI